MLRNSVNQRGLVRLVIPRVTRARNVHHERFLALVATLWWNNTARTSHMALLKRTGWPTRLRDALINH